MFVIFPQKMLRCLLLGLDLSIFNNLKILARPYVEIVHGPMIFCLNFETIFITNTQYDLFE